MNIISLKKEGGFGTCCNMHDPWGHCAPEINTICEKENTACFHWREVSKVDKTTKHKSKRLGKGKRK